MDMRGFWNICLPGNDNRVHCFREFRGRWLVLYFYPRDNTPGCTAEALEFTSLRDEFEKLGATVVGISRDSVDSHVKFAAKHGISILLLSDEEGKVIGKFGVWKRKKRFGKEHFGIERSTFAISPEGKIAGEWRGVRAKGHASEVLGWLKKETGMA